MITQERLAEWITDVEYIRPKTAPTGTIAVVTLKNGFNVVGTAFCVDENEYNENMGREFAFANAQDKIFELLAFLEKEKQCTGS